ncbi:CPBP family intramembrane metalloprotease [Luteolibacter flavescens]|uniref:CPBP family intramembrane metalloprotease n=1 Tax=Luteolibacter flavescens TaxID=1859460 RepID=A0ABT3FRG6_9BACT|nr:CPBP family intramembrane glutamic endopeptidase [Luteolibacter flavescens]MCW1886173.1 CPBP family intramembrane metalloprotease [Luteolibacter flavescens]
MEVSPGRLTFRRVRRGQQSDVLKILAYVAATLVLAAIISPWLYQLGKGLAEVTADKQTNKAIDALAKAAGRAEFPRFFDRAMMLSALVLIFPLTAWLRLGRAPGSYRDTPWSLRLPDNVISSDLGQPLRRNPQGWLQFGTGFIIAAGLLLLSGWLMLQAGCFMWKDAEASTRGAANLFQQPIDWAKSFKKVVPGALIVSLIEEVLFRGVLLGIFLRAMRATPAVIALSLLFAFVHFLEPSPYVRVPDPESSSAGFYLLGQIFARFANPLELVSGLTVLFAVGLVLAYARIRTASLWLPIGLHFGWVVGFGIFKSATWAVGGLPEITRWFVGTTLREGLLPLSVVAVTGVLVHIMTRVPEPPASYRS